MSKLIINKDKTGSKINKNIYGHFSEHLGRCIYGGLYTDGKFNMPVVEALKKINIPLLRWPGGCFADEYHWQDGIGPKESRKRMINTHWGGVVEDNSFGTHEFMELCQLLGCEPYISGNVGSGTVREMSEWVEYMTFDGVSPMAELRKKNGREKAWELKYFGIGNENWGCGGNMSPQYYADVYKQYATYVRNYGENKIYKIACGPPNDNYHWTDVVMREAGKHMDGIALHYYTLVDDDWEKKGSATKFTEADYIRTINHTLRIDDYIKGHLRVMNQHDPEHKVALVVDEWGTWYDVEPDTNPGFLYQQNTMRDAIVAACNLNIFNSHCDRISMANIAQIVNVLQALILTEGDKMILTPTYHVFDLYKEHMENTLVESFIETVDIGEESKIPNLHVSASVDESGVMHITPANLSPKDSYPVTCHLGKAPKSVSARILTGKIDTYNDFKSPDNLKVSDFKEIKLTDDGFELTMPACSVMAIRVSQ